MQGQNIRIRLKAYDHRLLDTSTTIKLASSELMDELKDRKELLEDALLIRDQADR